MSSTSFADTLAKKAARIDHCVGRAREELITASDFRQDQTRQDAAILNVQRACERAIDMSAMVVAHEAWGIPQGAREVFALVGKRADMGEDLVAALQRMVGFRNVAVHEYDALDLDIAERVIRQELDALLRFAGLLVQRYLNTH